MGYSWAQYTPSENCGSKGMILKRAESEKVSHCGLQKVACGKMNRELRKTRGEQYFRSTQSYFSKKARQV